MAFCWFLSLFLEVEITREIHVTSSNSYSTSNWSNKRMVNGIYKFKTTDNLLTCSYNLQRRITYDHILLINIESREERRSSLLTWPHCRTFEQTFFNIEQKYLICKLNTPKSIPGIVHKRLLRVILKFFLGNLEPSIFKWNINSSACTSKTKKQY